MTDERAPRHSVGNLEVVTFAGVLKRFPIFSHRFCVICKRERRLGKRLYQPLSFFTRHGVPVVLDSLLDISDPLGDAFNQANMVGRNAPSV